MLVANGPVVFITSDPNAAVPEADEEAISQFVSATARWLDSHLTDLQNGGAGLIAEIAMDGLLDQVKPEALLAATSDLASPDRTVDEATYDVLVAVDGAPQWMRVTVETTSTDGDVGRAQFIFVPHDGWTRLVAAGPVPERTEEPAAEAEPGRDDAEASS